jgi:hypothetical protein
MLNVPVTEPILNQPRVAEYDFRVACNMNLEGIVSKRLDRAYDAGKCKHWVKVKNPAHPAYNRVTKYFDRPLYADPRSTRRTLGLDIPANKLGPNVAPGPRYDAYPRKPRARA